MTITVDSTLFPNTDWLKETTQKIVTFQPMTVIDVYGKTTEGK